MCPVIWKYGKPDFGTFKAHIFTKDALTKVSSGAKKLKSVLETLKGYFLIYKPGMKKILPAILE